jgi:predicted AAA+ superfamily ATPase
VIFQLPAPSRNVRNEIKNGKKVYFCDCGIRNAIINNFKPLTTRTDVGALWENFMIVERLKYPRYSEIQANHFFWRTTQQKEIDLIEEKDDTLTAFEFKWIKNAKAKIPLTFSENYPGSKTNIISPDNIKDMVTSMK